MQMYLNVYQYIEVCFPFFAARRGTVGVKTLDYISPFHCSSLVCLCLPLSFVLCNSLSVLCAEGCGNEGVVSAYLPFSLPLGVRGKGGEVGEGKKGEKALHKQNHTANQKRRMH